MSKKKKTRQQKMLSDQRRLHSSQVINAAPLTTLNNKNPIPNQQLYSLNINHLDLQKEKQEKSLTGTHPFLLSDLKKTALTTIGIIMAQFIFFFLLTTHILIFKGISY